MKAQFQSSTMPVLLGMALSLLAVFLVVGRADAATQCELCERNAWNKAKAACAGVGPNAYPTYDMCVYNNYMTFKGQDCSGICPGGGTISGSANCGSDACRDPGGLPRDSCGMEADQDSGSICDNSCWGKTCTSGSGSCVDQRATGSTSSISLCYWKCGCGQ